MILDAPLRQVLASAEQALERATTDLLLAAALAQRTHPALANDADILAAAIEREAEAVRVLLR